MGFWQAIVVSIGLSLDVFAYCLYKGAMISEIRVGCFARMAAIFTGFQMGMMIVGCAITRIPAITQIYRSASLVWEILAAIAFFVIGVGMILRSLRKRHEKIEERKQDQYNYRVIVFWAFITSIDSLIAGIGFGFLGFRLLAVTLLIGIVTAASAIAGLLCGYRLGCGPRNWLITIGGCIVLIGGVDVLINYFSVLY